MLFATKNKKTLLSNKMFVLRYVAIAVFMLGFALGVKAQEDWMPEGVHATGIEDGVVYLNDLEDHNWSYYQEACPINSPHPRNVKITYRGGNDEQIKNKKVAVSRSEEEHTFAYFKTLEQDNGKYLYTTIPNPFAKRPSEEVEGGKTYLGFAGWKLVSVKDGSVSNYNVGDIIPAEANMEFTFTSSYTANSISAEVVLEAVWEEAKIVHCNVIGLLAALSSSELDESLSYERNFIVINDGMNSATNITRVDENAKNKAATVMMVEPDGSEDYRQPDRYIAPDSITLYNDLKFEYINLQDNSTTINANAHDLVLGRGIKHPSKFNGLNATAIKGINEKKTERLDYQLRIESGIYTDLYFVSTDISCSGESKRIRSVLGNDYDRSKNNDNLLKIRKKTTMGTGMEFSGNTFESSSFNVTVKSGTFNANQTSPDSGNASSSFYISMSSSQTNAGSRTLIIEGGTFWNIAGGVDTNGNLLDKGDNGYDKTSVYIRMKGGTVKGCIYGGGAYAEGYGNRKLIFTGGTVGGWIAAGCNGTRSSGGRTYGSSYVYVGGNMKIESQCTVNGAAGGQIFGAGKGYASSTGTSGEMTYGTTVVVADNATVAGDVYGGGFYGYVPFDKKLSSKVYILGGTIEGTVYGGSNMKGGASTSVVVTGGLVKGDIYGGSNTQGEILGTSISMSSGTVEKCIFGGGNNAPIDGDTNVLITGGEIKCNVYGGGNQAKVAGNTHVQIGSQQ